MRELRKSGLTYAEIGRRFGISGQKAKRVLESNRAVRSQRDDSNGSRQMLTTGEFAALVGLHPNTVRRWSDKGLLNYRRIGSRGDRRFFRDDAESILKDKSRFVRIPS